MAGDYQSGTGPSEYRWEMGDEVITIDMNQVIQNIPHSIHNQRNKKKKKDMIKEYAMNVVAGLVQERGKGFKATYDFVGESVNEIYNEVKVQFFEEKKATLDHGKLCTTFKNKYRDLVDTDFLTRTGGRPENRNSARSGEEIRGLQKELAELKKKLEALEGKNYLTREEADQDYLKREKLCEFLPGMVNASLNVRMEGITDDAKEKATQYVMEKLKQEGYTLEKFEKMLSKYNDDVMDYTRNDLFIEIFENVRLKLGGE